MSESCGVTPVTKKKKEMMEKLREKKAKRETFGEFLTPHGGDHSMNQTIHTQQRLNDTQMSEEPAMGAYKKDTHYEDETVKKIEEPLVTLRAPSKRVKKNKVAPAVTEASSDFDLPRLQSKEIRLEGAEEEEEEEEKDEIVK